MAAGRDGASKSASFESLFRDRICHISAIYADLDDPVSLIVRGIALWTCVLNKQPGQEPVKPECGVGRWKDRIYWGMDKWTAQGWGVTRLHRRWKPCAVAAPVAHRPAILHAWSVEGGWLMVPAKSKMAFRAPSRMVQPHVPHRGLLTIRTEFNQAAGTEGNPRTPLPSEMGQGCGICCLHSPGSASP